MAIISTTMQKITIIAIGNKMPTWVDEAIKEFSKRLQEFVVLKIIEIPMIRRGKSNDLPRILEKEKNLILTSIPNDSRKIALEIGGETFNSESLAMKIQKLQQVSNHLCFLIGGPEGFVKEVLAQCDERWSLSQLTLPHTLARIILLETIYRAYTILQNHPYHK